MGSHGYLPRLALNPTPQQVARITGVSHWRLSKDSLIIHYPFYV
jgi:hypothetical protein